MFILVLFDKLQLTRYSSRQKAGVSGNKRENTSRRPANIKKELSITLYRSVHPTNQADQSNGLYSDQHY